MSFAKSAIQVVLLFVSILVPGCSNHTTQKTPMTANKYELIDRTKYRVFGFPQGEASRLRVNSSGRETFQLLFLIKNSDGIFPACIVYRAQRYGAWGMIPSSASQLGFVAVSTTDDPHVFSPHPESGELTILLFRTMTTTVSNHQQYLEFGDWKVVHLESPLTSIELSLSEPDSDLKKSHGELEASLQEIPAWVEFNSRYQNTAR